VIVLVVTATLLLFPLTNSDAQSGENPPTSSPQYSNQNLRFEHLTSEDGLSSNEVLSILQDSNGFMWFGTFNGLNRYDGHTITVFKSDPNNLETLSGNRILQMVEDQRGNIWIRTGGNAILNRFDPLTETFTRFLHDPEDPGSISSDRVGAPFVDQLGFLWAPTGSDGLNRFDPVTETFTHYLHDPGDPSSISDDSIGWLFDDQDGFLWIVTGVGLDRFDPATETFTHYQHDPQDPNSLGPSALRYIVDDNEGNLWIATWGSGLSKLDRETGQFTHFRHDPVDPASLSSDNIRWLYGDSSGNIWIVNEDRMLDRLEPNSGLVTRYRHEPGNLHSIFDGAVRDHVEDSYGTLWLAGEKGLSIYDPDTEQITTYIPDLLDLHSLSNLSVSRVYKDQAGIMWIGTRQGGVNIYNPATERFTRYQNDPNDPESLATGAVQGAYEDADGMIWLGHRPEGLDKLDPTTGKFTHYRHDPEDPNGLSAAQVRVIYEDSYGVFWIGTASGLDQFDREGEQFRHMNDFSLLAAYEDSSGVLWIGTQRNSGLYRFDRERETFEAVEPETDDPEGFSWGPVSAVVEDSTGALWVGSWNTGLTRYDRDTGQMQNYQHDPMDPQSLSDNRVEALHVDGTGQLWIGTGNGVNQYYPDSETFTHYLPKDGLPDNFVNGILEESAHDDQGLKVWFGTKKGLARFDPLTETFQNYNTSHGLQGNASDVGYYKTSDGMMIWGNETGFTTFYPDQITSDPYVPPVVLTNLKLLNKAVPIGGDSPLQQAVRETDHLTLSHEDDVITIEFAALSYANPAENLLQYKMEGFDTDWSPVSTNNSATYTNLDPGDYVFRVRGSNSDGVWNEQGTSLGITITPPWWGTIWFRGGLILLLVAGLFGAYRWRVSSIESRSQQLETQVAEKTKELATLLAVSQKVTSTLELEPLLSLILDELKKVVDYDVGTIRRLVDGNMELQAHRWLYPQAGQPSMRLPVAKIPIVREMVQSRQAILVDDHQFSPAFVGEAELFRGNLTGDVLQASRTLMCVPLVLKDEVIGMLVLGHHQPSYWGEEIKELVQTFANQAAVAIANAELFEKAGEAATLEERTRLARELHDSATQSLYSATLFNEAGKELAQQGDLDSARYYQSRVGEVVNQALKDMRLLVFQLRRPVLQKEGLVMALQHRLDAVEKRAGMDARLISDQRPSLSDPVSEELYSITIEALNNTLKHAQADKVTITIQSDERGLELEVRDDGQGFDPQTAQNSGGMGLVSMAERASILGGDLTIDSNPDQGTSIRVSVPLPESPSKSSKHTESRE
jgi:signal transduction histidine kinase/ligand-binding sensor domain-containing protein